MKTILLTGFGPFADIARNPSQTLVEAIGQHHPFSGDLKLVTEILPVIFDQAPARIRELVQQHQPDIVLPVGVAAKREKVCLERVALDLKDTPQPDNSGKQPQGELLIPEGPLAYFSNLPLLEMQQFLLEAGIPTAISNHAGTYLCNAVFYAAAHQVETLGLAARYGFIHIPMIPERPKEESKLSIPALARSLISLFDRL